MKAPVRRTSLRLSALPPPTATSTAPVLPMRWRPSEGPELMVMQGDLTEARVDAIVSPANSELSVCGGLAAAIAMKGGSQLAEDCDAWIDSHERLPVGHAMATRAGKLPCRYVIHAVGPQADFSRVTNLGADQAQLRTAVRNALGEAQRLKLKSVAFPVISSGHFEFPVALAATAIVEACVQYVNELVGRSSLQTIVLMGGDAVTHNSFTNALRGAVASSEAAVVATQAGSEASATPTIARSIQIAELTVANSFLPPEPPFEYLSPQEAEYKRTLARLPQLLRDNVVGVRRVRAPARHADYETLKQELQGSATVEEVTLFHGTPERWRATAIALGGFNRNIHVGRPSHTTGVYTASDANYAYSYAAGRGSLLMLRGLVVSNAAVAAHNTIVQAPVYIFPNPKALLSLMVVDFASEDKRDLEELQKHRH